MMIIVAIIGTVVLIVIGRVVDLIQSSAAFERRILGCRLPRNKVDSVFVDWINEAGTNRRQQRDMAVQLMKGLGGSEANCANMILGCMLEAMGNNGKSFGEVLAEQIRKNIHFEKTAESTPEGQRQILELIESRLIALDEPKATAA
jgi:hypothetical protein